MQSAAHDQEVENQALFEPLRPVRPRNPAKASQAREAFLIQARQLTAESSQVAAVSISPFTRLKECIETLMKPVQRRERAPVLTTLSTLIVIATLIFGGAGATAYAAGQSLPDETLYQMKLFGEDLRLRFTYQEQARLEVVLTYANRRMEEIANMLASGKAAPEPTLTRLQAHMEYALRLAAQMEGEAALQQVRLQLQHQLRLLEEWQNGYPEQAGLLLRLRERLTEQLRLCELGLEDPLQLQNQLRLRQQDGAGPNEAPPQGNEQAPSPGPKGPAPDPNGGSLGPGPNPEPGSGHGAGPGECNECEPPQDGTGTGPGPNPDPGGNGDGPGECNDCQPPQDGTGSVPGPNPDPGDSHPANLPAGETHHDAPIPEGSGPTTGGSFDPGK